MGSEIPSEFYTLILLTLLGGLFCILTWMDFKLERARLGWSIFFYRDEQPYLFGVFITIQLLGAMLIVITWLIMLWSVVS